MKIKKNHWEVALSDENRKELDEDLINRLNEEYDGDLPVSSHKPKGIRLVGLVTAIVFLALVFGNWFTLISFPSLGFLHRSSELAQHPEIQKLRQAVVEISSANSKGTGFNIDERGLIITNYHVVKNTSFIKVTFYGGAAYNGRVLASFPEIDLAVISIEGENLPTLELETGKEAAAGDKVTIIGNPLWFSHVAKEGEIVGKTMLKEWDIPVFKVRAPIHKGNSGSPVINSDGKVVAVIFATLESQTEEIMGLAVPVRHIDNLYTERE